MLDSREGAQQSIGQMPPASTSGTDTQQPHHPRPHSHAKSLKMVWQGQVPVYWVPQLQLEMLASGTPSVILLSRSATKVCSLQRSFIILSGSDAAAWPW